MGLPLSGAAAGAVTNLMGAVPTVPRSPAQATPHLALAPLPPDSTTKPSTPSTWGRLRFARYRILCMCVVYQLYLSRTNFNIHSWVNPWEEGLLFTEVKLKDYEYLQWFLSDRRFERQQSVPQLPPATLIAQNETKVTQKICHLF